MRLWLDGVEQEQLVCGHPRSDRGRVKIAQLGRGSALLAEGTTRNSTRQLRIPACVVPSIYLAHVAQLSFGDHDFRG